MRETYQTPTTSPAGHPHDHTHPRHSRTLLRHSRVGGNPPRCVHTPGASAPSRRLQNPTESDKIRRKLVCARSSIPAHAREAPHPPPSFPRRRESLLPTWIVNSTYRFGVAVP